MLKGGNVMGIYLNPDNGKFQRALNSQIYVDKSDLINFTNNVLYTEQQYICVSRPRRFGKSMTLNMLSAYYSLGADSKSQFNNLKISQSEGYEKHLNKYNVIFINMQEFLSNSNNMDEMLDILKRSLLWELTNEFSSVRFFNQNNLSRTMMDIYAKFKTPFIILIDEWDCIFREHRNDKDSQKKYLDFLRNWLKDKEYLALAYMTGILPIKKYGTHSALNMFAEYSMIDSVPLSSYIGFTENEVRELCNKYDSDLDSMRYWYDGYYLDNVEHIYCPRSVIMSITKKRFGSYWAETETYEALAKYISMDFDGLHSTIENLLAGQRETINTRSFSNDMVTFECKDDILTLLVHLGYLGYIYDTKEIYIPNKEVADEFITSMSRSGLWKETMEAVQKSNQLLKDTLNKNTEKIENAISEIHRQTVSPLQYNNEQALRFVILLAYYSAREYYNIVQEMPCGEGFADIMFIPRYKHSEYPAMIIELKWNKSADTAINQIEEKKYFDNLNDCKKVLLVGINYDKNTKKHECKIEEFFN